MNANLPFANQIIGWRSQLFVAPCSPVSCTTLNSRLPSKTRPPPKPSLKFAPCQLQQSGNSLRFLSTAAVLSSLPFLGTSNPVDFES